MSDGKVVVIGAGVAGLVSALELARAGYDVQVFERHSAPGGKVRQVFPGGASVDAGPTVFTMRWVFERIFGDAGKVFADEVRLKPLSVLARHAWSADERLDLFANAAESADAIGAFAGAAEAEGFRTFCARARDVYQTLEEPFIRSPQPSPISLAFNAGLKGLGGMLRISPFSTLWSALGDHFKDPRLRQLFGRYATYCGSSPFEAPATLMLVAHVEQDGVWSIEGGMYSLAQALERIAKENGARFTYGAEVEEVLTRAGRVMGVRLRSGEVVEAGQVIVNADTAAVAAGLLGRSIAPSVSQLRRDERSLSAMTWVMNAKTSGFPLTRHNVFFSRNYQAEFDDIFGRSRLPREPTVYVCAQDRGDDPAAFAGGRERLLVLVNAPATGDMERFTGAEAAECEERTFALLKRLGLDIERETADTILTTPADFNELFPATGGALYGAASHGWMASFSRPGGTTRIPGLYLAGGSVHPGPGVPMAALSGWLAAAQLAVDHNSTRL